MKKKLLFLLIFSTALLCACGTIEHIPNTPAASPDPTVTPVITPAPTPEPTPIPEPELLVGSTVIINGTVLPRSVEKNGQTYVPKWELETLFEDAETSARTLSYHGSEWIEVESFCTERGLGVLRDEEYDTVYYSAALGDWTAPADVKVPVVMYYGVTDSPWGYAELFVRPDEFELQLQYLQENGYTPIFFEDLQHIEDYEKPVLLTFDCGYLEDYTDVFPLLKQYNMKANVFVICGWIGGDVYLSADMIRDMADSGLVSFQSQGVSFENFTLLSPEELELQMRDSRLAIARLTGRVPIAVSYPFGLQNEEARLYASRFYKYAVVMHTGRNYITGTDPMLISRMYVGRSTNVYMYSVFLRE